MSIALGAMIISLLVLLTSSGLMIQSLIGKSAWQRRTRRVWRGHVSSSIQAPPQIRIGLILVIWGWSALCASIAFVIPFWLDMVLSALLTAFLLVGLITCELYLGRMVLANPPGAPESAHPQYLKVHFLRAYGIEFLFALAPFPWMSELANGLLGYDVIDILAAPSLELLLAYVVIALLYFLSAWLYRRWLLARRRHMFMHSQSISARYAHLPSRRALLGLAAGGAALSVGGGWWLWSRFQRWYAMLPIENRPFFHSLAPPTLAYWSRDLQYVAVESDDGKSLSLWDVEKRQVFGMLHIPGNDLLHEGIWSPDNRFFSLPLAEGQNGVLAIFEMSSGKQLSLPSASPSYYYFGWSPNSQWIASLDGQLSIWEVASGKLLQQEQLPGASGLAWSADGKRIALAVPDGIKIWDVAANQLVKEIALNITSTSQKLSWSPDGSHLALGDGEQPLTVVNYAQPDNIFVISIISDGQAIDELAFAWSPDGQYLAVGANHALEVWSVTQKMPVRRYAIPLFSHPITDVSWSSDSRSIVAVDWSARRTWSWS